MHDKSQATNINLNEIEAQLKTKWLGRSSHANELWNSIDSTNNRAIELGRSGADSGVIVIASQQTAGRGRGGNVWLSPANSGLYMSFLVKPNLALKNLPVVTLITGVVVVRVIQSCLGIKVGLKWVNDLIVEGKKVGGILTEYVSCSGSADKSALVIGIGLNLYKPDQLLPVELQGKIAFLASFLPELAEPTMNCNRLLARMINELESALELMHSDTDLLLDQWRAYSITLGEEIVAQIGDEVIIGQAVDITKSGELLVKTKSGSRTLMAGNVRIRKLDGSYV